MKNLILICFLFSVSYVFSQGSEKTIEDNVIFILANSKNGGYYQKLYSNESTFYNYYFSAESKERINKITLVFSKFKDFDHRDINNPVPYFKANKSFLKKNRDRIITVKSMRKIGYSKSYEMIKKSKHIFLIEKSETNRNVITFKEVFFSYVGEE